MSIVSIFNGIYCHGEEVADLVAQKLGLPVLRDQDLINKASESSGIPAAKLARAMFEKPSIFNNFSHEQARAIAALKAAAAETLAGEDSLLLLGYQSHLIPRQISHVLSVCLIAEHKYRVALGSKRDGVSAREAASRIHKADEACLRWVANLGGGDAWSPELYDMLIPMGKTEPAAAAEMIAENASSPTVKVTEGSRSAVRDFQLAASVGAVLAAQGHSTQDLAVSVHQGNVLIEINKKVLMLSRLEEELTKLAKKVAGVGDVSTKVGPGYYQADVYRRTDFDLPSRVLLVDDEREFVQTLSERLMMREIGSAVVYDGEQALSLAAEDEPEVIVLDLRMPGIDGIEVLRRMKQNHPNVEVIILTGHGSEKDKDVCMKLGAFAYLEKPVDIDVLSQTMREAYAKMRSEA